MIDMRAFNQGDTAVLVRTVVVSPALEVVPIAKSVLRAL
jgi:hypothetical protein